MLGLGSGFVYRIHTKILIYKNLLVKFHAYGKNVIIDDLAAIWRVQLLADSSAIPSANEFFPAR